MFFFKQKTAYEMRISDWSSDVCSSDLYEHALKLWEGLSQDLNYNVMFSQRGVLNLAHNQHDLRETWRRVHANRLNGIDSEFLTAQQVQEMVPIMDLRSGGRYPVLGASLQRRGGTARHDAVRSEEHTSELQSLMRISYAVFCLKKK